MSRPRPQQSARLLQARSLRPGLESLESRRLLAAVPTFDTTSLTTSGSTPNGICLADFNGDGARDMAYALLSSGRIGLRMGRGDGSFADETTFATGEAPYDVAAADFNRDGAADLVVSDLNDFVLRIYLGRGDGTFQLQTGSSANRRPMRVRLADLDRNSSPDLVVGYDSQEIGVYYGSGGGSFDGPYVIPVGDTCLGFGMGDLDGDSDPDIVVVGDATVYLLRNDGYGQFTNSLSYRTQGRGGRSVNVAPININSRIDVTVAFAGSNYVQVFQGDGRGGFSDSTRLTVDDNPPGDRIDAAPLVVAATDLNFDGGNDLIIGTTKGVQIRPSENLRTRVDTSNQQESRFHAIADLDKDGRIDIVMTSPQTNTIQVMRNVTRTPPPATTIVIDSVTVTEADAGEQLVQIPVSLERPTTEPVSVTYATIGGTAVAGTDYTAVQGVLTIPERQTRGWITVPVAGNLRVDGTRTIGLKLTSPSFPASLKVDTATLTIVDNEVPSTIRFRESGVLLDPSTGVASLTVVRDDDRSDGVTVGYATVGGTAVAGVDYAPTTGTLRFAPGQKSLTVQIPLLDHAWWAEGKTIEVRLLDTRGGQVDAPGWVVATIVTPAPVVVRSAVPRAGTDGKLTDVVLTFSGPLDAKSARTLSQYKLVTAGRDGVLGTRDDQALGLRVSYATGSRQVTLSVPTGRRVGPYRLTVGPKLLDARRRAVDGDANGQAGGTFATVLRT